MTGPGMTGMRNMDWTYRIIDHGQHFALHEVFVDDDGRPVDWVPRSIDFACDRDVGREGLIAALEKALAEARRSPVLALRSGRLESVES